MTPDRLLAWSRRWLDSATVASVFEPLTADWQHKLDHTEPPARPRSNRRWQLAGLLTVMKCAPRILLTGLPFALALDLEIRATAFVALAIALQWLAYALQGPRFGVTWPPTLATALPFAVMPVVFRIRQDHTLTDRARRTLILQVLLILITAALLFTGGSLIARLLVAACMPGLLYCGWKLCNYDPEAKWPVDQRWFRVVGLVIAMRLATYPMHFALGVPFWSWLWPGGDLMLYLYAAIAVLTLPWPEKERAKA